MAKFHTSIMLATFLAMLPAQYVGPSHLMAQVPEDGPPSPDFSGTYASEPVAPDCTITVTSAVGDHRGLRAIHIAQSRDVMTSRLAPMQGVRVLYIERRHHTEREWRATIRNGVGHWEGDALVVES